MLPLFHVALVIFLFCFFVHLLDRGSRRLCATHVCMLALHVCLSVCFHVDLFFSLGLLVHKFAIMNMHVH
jgi:hypothetical protein